MRDFRTKMIFIEGIDSSFRTYCEAHCLHCVEYIEGHIRDHESCELTLVEAINLMEAKLAGDCKKNRVFATLLHNLGYVYEVTGRFDEAHKLYQKALLADRTAVDYRSEAERKANIEASEASIRRIDEKRKKSGGGGGGSSSAQQIQQQGAVGGGTGSEPRKFSMREM